MGPRVRRSRVGVWVNTVLGRAKALVGSVCEHPKCKFALFRQIPSSFYDDTVNGMEARIADMVQRKGGRVPK